MQPKNLSANLRPFACADQPAVEQKLARFARDGADTWHVVFDFDRTLTCANEQGKDFYTWTILESFLPPEFIAPSKQLYRTYRPLEINGTLTEALALEWWNRSLKLMQDAGVNLFEVEREFVSRASIRPGVVSLFELCRRYGIPTIILSAGVTNVIELWCRHYGIEPTVILATPLKLTPDGFIAGWDSARMIHARNKREQGHGELSRLQVERPHIFLIGDSLDDADMVGDSDSVLRTRIYDPRPDERDTAATQRATLERFDLLLASGSLEPLA